MSTIRTLGCITHRQPETMVDEEVRNRFQDILDEWCAPCISEWCEHCDNCEVMRLSHFIIPKTQVRYDDLILFIPDGTRIRFVYSSGIDYEYRASVIDVTHLELIKLDQIHGTVYHSAQLENLRRQNENNVLLLTDGEWVTFREIIKEENN